MARKSKKSLELEQIKATLIVWWIAILCLIGIGFISILYVQYESEENKEITTLDKIEIEDEKNYGEESTPVKVKTYNTTLNGNKYSFFTLDSETEVNDEKVYGGKELIEDDGIISILKNGNYLSDSIPEKDRKAITQLALWIHNGYLEDDEREAVLNGVYGSYIRNLVQKASDESYEQSSIVLSTNTPSISLSKDKKYYISELIELRFSNEYTVVDYDLNLKDAPKGTKIIDENGKTIKDIKNVKKFYLKIPENRVNADNKNFHISVNVTTSDYYAYGFRTAVNKSEEADVILNDLQVVLNNTDTSISLYIPKDTGVALINRETILGFLALCTTAAVCGIIILIINAVQSKRELDKKRKKRKRKK